MAKIKLIKLIVEGKIEHNMGMIEEYDWELNSLKIIAQINMAPDEFTDGSDARPLKQEILKLLTVPEECGYKMAVKKNKVYEIKKYSGPYTRIIPK